MTSQINSNNFENYSRKEANKTSSDQVFGFVFSTACVLIGIIRYWPHWEEGKLWFLAAAVFFLIAASKPSLLHPCNKLWTKFGFLLHRITTPFVMAIMFYGLFTPMGLIGKILKKDPLKLKARKNVKTYWIARNQEEHSNLKNQF